MNLLVDPVFRVRTSAGIGKYDLPGLMALLGEDKIESLPGLQRHQEDAFHVFLCYLAGAVLARSGASDPSQGADYWREGVRDLTRQEGCADDSAWTLVVEDPTKPAFMQPPAPDRATFERDYKLDTASPDAFDVLQTAKNHDVKQSRSTTSDIEAWTFALLSKQTMTGLLGKGNGGGMNRGIARMNSGHGSRPVVSWQPTHRSQGNKWSHDVEHLLLLRNHLLEPPYQYVSHGKTLIWVTPWSGNDSLSLNTLGPFFIEIARRIRLRRNLSGLEILTAGSTATRIAADELKGNLGDPWIPIHNRTNKALKVQEKGLTIDLIKQLIFGDGNYKSALMQEPMRSEKSGWFSASVLVRGEGTTDGFHEASVRIPERARQVLFGGGVQRDRLSRLSKEGIDIAAKAREALRKGLFSFLEGGPEPKKIDYDKREVKRWVNGISEQFDQNWATKYYDWLWTTLAEQDDLVALQPWFATVSNLAKNTLTHAFMTVPLRSGRTYRAQTRARGMFFGSLKENFSHYLEATNDHP